MILYLYLIILISLIKIKCRSKSVSYLLLLCYIGSAFMAIVIYHFFPEYDKLYNMATLYFIICNLIFISPFIKAGNRKSRDYILPNKLISYLAKFLLVFGLISLFYTIPKLLTVQALVNNLSDIRSAYYQGDVDILAPSSFLDVLANWALYIMYLAPFCSVYYYSQGNNRFSALLFIASMSYPLHWLLIGEREATLVFLMNYIFSFVFFSDSIEKAKMKKIIKLGLIAISPFIIFLIGMTVSRFGERDSGVWGSLLSYGGEQPFNFSYFLNDIDIQRQKLGGVVCFPQFFPNSDFTGDLNDYITSDQYLNVFAGAPGSFVLDFGYSAIIIVILFSLVWDLLLSLDKKSKRKSFVSFILMYLLFQILFMNIFYFDFKGTYVWIMNTLLIGTIWIYEQICTKKHNTYEKHIR